MATVEKIDVFSGHGDQNDLLKFVSKHNPERVKKVFLVHGEEESMVTFKGILEEKGYSNVEMPEKGQSYEL
ncbi:MBL fold metallo-hydrolase RNA specificity domain-containing protein [Flectobacillus longus]|uniref:MBL fold metallo-hydrolase RNA specificity domain-containing protein n=1 Tax=Flectobacillus longus TaxID=2984207 RepID=UPI0038D45042